MCFTATVEIGGGLASPIEDTERLLLLLADLRLHPADLITHEATGPTPGAACTNPDLIRDALIRASGDGQTAIFTTLADTPRLPLCETLWASLNDLLAGGCFAWRLTRRLPGDAHAYSVVRAGGGFLRQPLQIVVDLNGLPAIHPHAATVYERDDGTWPDVLEICRNHSLINRPMPGFAAPLQAVQILAETEAV
jgi:hypothetical protein